MCCWNRWPAARRWWRATSPAIPKWCRSRAAGLIVPANTPEGIAAAVRDRYGRTRPARAATRAYAERFGWEETSRGQLELFRRVVGGARGTE